MASNASRTLKLIFAADNKQAIGAVRGVEGSLGGLQSKAGGVGSALAGVFSVGAITAFANKAVDGWEAQAASVAKLKRLTGDSAENASLLNFAAQQNGVNAEKAATSFVRLAKAVKAGKVDAQGIATTDGNGKLASFDTILGRVADRYKALAPGIERSNLLTELFGRGSADIGKILKDGSAGIEAYREEMQSLGLEFNDAGLKKYAKFKAEQRDAQAALAGVEVELAQKVIPAFERVDRTVTSAGKAFQAMPGWAKDAVEVGAAVTVAGTAAVGAAAGFGFLRLGFKNIGWQGFRNGAKAAAAAEVELTAANDAMAAGEAAAEASQIAFNDAIAAGLPIEAASAEAAAARAAALEASTVATEEATATSTGLAGALGPIAVGAVAAGFAIKGLHDAFTGKQGSLKNTPLDPKVLGGTNAELVKAAENIAKMEKLSGRHIFAGEDVKVLKALQLALRETGQDDIPALNKAIADDEKANHRAAQREKEFGSAVKDTTVHIGGKAKALAKVDKAIADDISKAESQIDAQRAVSDAEQQRQTDITALATAQQAAVGNSDEYRQAVDDIASAEKDETAAKADATSAQHDLNDARAQAIRDLFNLHRAVIETGDDEIAKQDAAARAAEEARRKGADLRATDLDKAEAQHQATAAQHQATAAAEDHAQAITDAAAAQRAGIEGDKDVVAAKAKVKDAEDKVRESVDKVSDAQAAARKVITDAKAAISEASQKVKDDTYDEGKAFGNLALLMGGANDQAKTLLSVLQAMGADPNIIAILKALLPGVGTPSSPVGQGELPNRPQGAPHAPGSPGGGGSGGGGGGLLANNITMNLVSTGTPRQVQKSQAAAAKKSLDELWRGAR